MILEEIQIKLKQSPLSALFIVDPIDLKYVTGLALSSAALIITPSSAHLFVDGRYVLMAEMLKPVFQIHSGSKSETKNATAHVLGQIQGPIGFDEDHTSYGEYQTLLQKVPSADLVSASRFFRDLRREKHPEEISKIKKACQICEEGLSHVLGRLRPGITEQELEQEIKLFWLSHGADDVAFSPIIAFGANSACPHWSCSNTALKKDSIILLDLGVQKDGYNSDMTRVVFYGDVDDDLRQCFTHVEKTFRGVMERAKPGVLPHDLDVFAREYLATCGHKDGFPHGLGHGVGMRVHEPPRLSPERPDEGALKIGDVITIEPGLYIEGKGGVRLEDTFVVEKEGVRSLFSLPAKLIEISV